MHFFTVIHSILIPVDRSRRASEDLANNGMSLRSDIDRIGT